MTYNPEEMASYEILRYGTVENCWSAYINEEDVDIGAIELIFGRYARFAYFYALQSKSRFELGEQVISKNSEYAVKYARHILKGRFELGEPEIAKSPEDSYQYARYVLKERFKIGEPAILQSPEHCYWYAVNVIKKEWPECVTEKFKKSRYYEKYYKRFLAGKNELGS